MRSIVVKLSYILHIQKIKPSFPSLTFCLSAPSRSIRWKLTVSTVCNNGKLTVSTVWTTCRQKKRSHVRPSCSNESLCLFCLVSIIFCLVLYFHCSQFLFSQISFDKFWKFDFEYFRTCIYGLKLLTLLYLIAVVLRLFISNFLNRHYALIR